MSYDLLQLPYNMDAPKMTCHHCHLAIYECGNTKRDDRFYLSHSYSDL